jgi:hypothetical protein
MDKVKVWEWLGGGCVLGKPGEGDVCFHKSELHSFSDYWWIAAISTRFAELGRNCSLKRWSRAEWTIREYVFDHELEEIVDTAIGHGTTPLEAWVSAAEKEVENGTD